MYMYLNKNCGGLMVSVHFSISSGSGVSLGRGDYVCSWERHYSTQAYKIVTGKLNAGVALQ